MAARGKVGWGTSSADGRRRSTISGSDFVPRNVDALYALTKEGVDTADTVKAEEVPVEVVKS